VTPGGWSAAELATLAGIAETFVRGDAMRRANLAVRAIERSLDPEQVAGLRRVVRLVESRPANLLLFRRPVRFRDIDPPTRERYLLAWANSPLAMRRSAFTALRQLLTFLAYADPGDSGTNPRWTVMGYVPERPPVASEPTTISPFALTPDATGDLMLDADVVIVGSGAGGGVVAAALATAGRSVIVLEAGPFVDERTMPRGELEGTERLYLNRGFGSTWDGAVTVLAGASVGGGTVVNWTTWASPGDEVRDDWRRDHGLDTGSEFDSDIVELRRELWVMPAATQPPKDAAILRGAAELGWRASVIDRNAIGCTDCGSCGFGCPRGTKQSGIRAHLATAHAAGARIVPGAHVDRVIVDGGRATGVAATVESEGGALHLSVHAPQVVVAGGALNTPRILERSGVAHSAIGRHLRIHPVAGLAYRLREPVRMWLGPTQAARVDEFRNRDAGRNGYVIESAPVHPGLLALALPWEGTEAHAGVMEGAGQVAPLIGITSDGGEGRITSTRNGSLRIDYRLDPRGVATLRHALVSMARLARAAGAAEIVGLGLPAAVFGRYGFPAGGEAAAFAAFEDRLRAFDFRPNRAALFSAHQMGTARMGGEAGAHAVDPDGHVRDSRGRAIGGLYVADGSLFPTAIGIDPMLTIMALARRVARTVAAEA
jgi:choline dehydrogenase-like flavoprotein